MGRVRLEPARFWLGTLALVVLVSYVGTQLALGEPVFVFSMEGIVMATTAATLVAAVFLAWVGYRFVTGVLY